MEKEEKGLSTHLTTPTPIPTIAVVQTEDKRKRRGLKPDILYAASPANLRKSFTSRPRPKINTSFLSNSRRAKYKNKLVDVKTFMFRGDVDPILAHLANKHLQKLCQSKIHHPVRNLHSSIIMRS